MVAPYTTISVKYSLILQLTRGVWETMTMVGEVPEIWR